VPSRVRPCPHADGGVAASAVAVVHLCRAAGLVSDAEATLTPVPHCGER